MAVCVKGKSPPTKDISSKKDLMTTIRDGGVFVSQHIKKPPRNAWEHNRQINNIRIRRYRSLGSRPHWSHSSGRNSKSGYNRSGDAAHARARIDKACEEPASRNRL